MLQRTPLFNVLIRQLQKTSMRILITIYTILCPPLQKGTSGITIINTLTTLASYMMIGNKDIITKKS